MQVKIIETCGLNQAILGMGLSFGKTSDVSIEQLKEDSVLFKRLYDRARELGKKDGGHNKFLESIIAWVDIDAPLYIWKQIDTYRMATKQSESTMHTVLKRPLNPTDFEDNFIHPTFLEILNEHIAINDFNFVNAHLPQGFLQRRIVCLSYKTIRNMILQRRHHKLKQWDEFINIMTKKLPCGELLGVKND